MTEIDFFKKKKKKEYNVGEYEMVSQLCVS